MIRLRQLAAAGVLLLLLPPALPGQTWEAIHREMKEALGSLSQEYFAGSIPASEHGSVRQVQKLRLPSPWLIVVGFTGGLETKNSRSSGIVAINKNLIRHVGDQGEVWTLTYNNFRWRRALSDVMEAVRTARERAGNVPGYRQPLIVAHGHSWGAGSVTQLARSLKEEGVEISLAIYIDAFQFRNPRLPDNIRYAVNFYQRSGILSGLPIRGKRLLIPDNPEKTVLLGSYRVDPETDHWGWSWNPLQPLFYRQHHRISHDIRLREYLLSIIDLKLETLERTYATGTGALPSGNLFDSVVILGASVSAAEKSPSAGWLLARHLGTPEEKIQIFAKGGAESSHHLGYLDNIQRLKPTLIVALDLFYHDFKVSLFLTQSKKDYMRDYIRRLHETGAVVVLGNIPGIVLLRHEHVNRYLESLLPEFPNLLLVDARELIEELNDQGFEIRVNGQRVVLRRDDVFADREHVNSLGSALLANMLLDLIRNRFPEKLPEAALPIDLSAYLPPQ